MVIPPIYLDNHATTCLDQQVLSAMLPYFTEHYGNPSSINHVYGFEAQAAVKYAREIIAQAINASPTEIIFTSGATESNNLAIKGIAESYVSRGQHIITVITEHNAVLDPCLYLESLGFEITRLGVQPDGLLDLELLEKNIRTDTILVSVMTANNEIGVIQPIRKIGKICQEHQVLFHTDAAQALGKLKLDVQQDHIDLMSLTAHKIYGPKGIGALYIRSNRHSKINLAPQLHGGGHERKLRSGTLNTPGIVGFAKAVEIANTSIESETKQIANLRDRLYNRLFDNLDGIHLNGHLSQRLAGNLNISLDRIDGSALLLGLQPIVAVSSGAACSSTKVTPSHVLLALGRTKEQALASIRFGISRFTTQSEIDQVIEHTIQTVKALQRKM